MKICIIPAGWDKDIIVKSIFKSAADKVYLIVPKVESPTTKVSRLTLEVADAVESAVKKFTKIERLGASYIDYLDAFAAIFAVIKKELQAGNELHINIATGNKILAAVLLTCAFLNKLKVYYSIPEEYDAHYFSLKRPYRKGIKKILEIPCLPINLNFDKKEKELVLFVKHNKLIGVQDYLKRFDLRDENKGRAQFHYYVTKLKELGLLKVNLENGRRNIALTETGELISNMLE